jgi:hypothetical protein
MKAVVSHRGRTLVTIAGCLLYTNATLKNSTAAPMAAQCNGTIMKYNAQNAEA